MADKEIAYRVNWDKDYEQLEDEAAVNALLKQISTPLKQKKIIIVHSWHGRAPITFEGFVASSSDASDPNGPDKHFIFTLSEEINGHTRFAPERFVWPIKFARPDENLYPLLGVQFFR